MNTIFTNFADVYVNTLCKYTRNYTSNNKQFYKTLNNTMYIGAAQADIIVMPRTTHFLKYTP